MPAGISGAENAGRGHALQRAGHHAGGTASGSGVLYPHGHGAAVYSFGGNDGCIYGRGSCDAKGIIVAQIAAAEKLKKEGIHVGLLFLVGEERDSQGAQTANEQPRGAKFLINGEPTENRLALASKGTLRIELTASGKMAHSAYPELGESAIDKLIVALSGCARCSCHRRRESGPARSTSA